MERRRSDAEREHFGEAVLGAGQSQFPGHDPEMIEPDADPLDTVVEDADLFLGTGGEDDPPHLAGS
jgi:hypothetical protein